MSLSKEHKDHEWEWRDPCVYCKDCGVRLYHGSLPQDEEDKAHTIETLDSLVHPVWFKSGEVRPRFYPISRS